MEAYSTFIRRRPRSGFYRRLLGHVSDNVLKNRAVKERASIASSNFKSIPTAQFYTL